MDGDGVNIILKSLYGRDNYYLSFQYVPRPSSGVSFERNTHGTLNLLFGDPIDLNSADSYDAVNECRGLLYFDTQAGESIICNPTTKKLKRLPHCPFIDNRVVGNNGLRQFTVLRSTGFGYDDSREDFKAVRMYYHVYNYKTRDECVEHVAEVYSFKANHWKNTEWPEMFWKKIDSMDTDPGRVIKGNCYWEAGLGSKPHILAFNFATETFYEIPAPISDTKYRYLFLLVEVDDELGVVVYAKPGPSKTENGIEVWVWNESSWKWNIRFTVTLDNVVRPLELKNHLLFLEEKISDKLVQLMVYDFCTDKSESLDVFDYVGKMSVIPYFETTPLCLPDEEPMERNDEEG